jgi:hypothetical protein
MQFSLRDKPDLVLADYVIDDFTTPLTLFSNMCDFAEGVQQNMLDAASHFNRLKTFKQPLNGTLYYNNTELKLCTDDSKHAWGYIVKAELCQNNSILICDGTDRQWLSGPQTGVQVLMCDSKSAPHYDKITADSIQDYNDEFCVLYSAYNVVQWTPLSKLIGSQLTVDNADYTQYINEYSVLCFLDNSIVWQNLDNMYVTQNHKTPLNIEPIIGCKTFTHNTEFYGDVEIHNKVPPSPLNMLNSTPNKMVLNSSLFINYAVDADNVIYSAGKINDVLCSSGSTLNVDRYKAPQWQPLTGFIIQAAETDAVADNKTLVWDGEQLIWDDLPWNKPPTITLADLPKGAKGQMLVSAKKTVAWVDRVKPNAGVVLGDYTATNNKISALPPIIRKMFDIIQPAHTYTDISEFLTPKVTKPRTSAEYNAMVTKLKLSKDFSTYWDVVIEPISGTAKYYEHLVKIDEYYAPGIPYKAPDVVKTPPVVKTTPPVTPVIPAIQDKIYINVKSNTLSYSNTTKTLTGKLELVCIGDTWFTDHKTVPTLDKGLDDIIKNNGGAVISNPTTLTIAGKGVKSTITVKPVGPVALLYTLPEDYCKSIIVRPIYQNGILISKVNPIKINITA